MPRKRHGFSSSVEVKIVEVSEEIPEGWHQPSIKEAEALEEVIVASCSKWVIAELDGGWINGRGYGGNVEAKGPRDLGHRVLIRRTRRAPARLTQGLLSLKISLGSSIISLQEIWGPPGPNF